jgi:hypothetical protein
MQINARPDFVTRLWNWGLSMFQSGPVHSEQKLMMLETPGARWSGAAVRVRAISDKVELFVDRLDSTMLTMTVEEGRLLANALAEAADKSENWLKTGSKL